MRLQCCLDTSDRINQFEEAMSFDREMALKLLQDEPLFDDSDGDDEPGSSSATMATTGSSTTTAASSHSLTATTSSTSISITALGDELAPDTDIADDLGGLEFPHDLIDAFLNGPAEDFGGLNNPADGCMYSTEKRQYSWMDEALIPEGRPTKQLRSSTTASSSSAAAAGSSAPVAVDDLFGWRRLGLFGSLKDLAPAGAGSVVEAAGVGASSGSSSTDIRVGSSVSKVAEILQILAAGGDITDSQAALVMD
jgi:hypothetical protein